MSKKKQPKIQFKIFNIKRVSHFENNFKDFGLNPKDSRNKCKNGGK